MKAVGTELPDNRFEAVIAIPVKFLFDFFKFLPAKQGDIDMRLSPPFLSSAQRVTRAESGTARLSFLMIVSLSFGIYTMVLVFLSDLPVFFSELVDSMIFMPFWRT